MRRKDRRISKEEATKILLNGEYGVLSICTPTNEGYGIPLNYAFVDKNIYFHCAPDGSKIDFIKNNNKVSFCVVGRTEILPSEFGTIYESAIASGRISNVSDEEKREALMCIIQKYSGDYIQEGIEYIDKYYSRVHVLKLSIETLTGKARKQ